MILAFNTMANAMNEREDMLVHMAEQQRQADLGRLTATIAHEVRNPLGGMRTAVSTLRRFGDREEARNDATEFLDRGISALQAVVDATLETYRGRPEWRALTRQDFDDLRLLVEADARSRDVALKAELDIPDVIPVAALDVRQALLNLLLNAVRASERGSTVMMSARIEGSELMVGVRDEGKGMDPTLARAIETGATAPAGDGLGVAVVMKLVEKLQGRITIEADPSLGTTVLSGFPSDRSRRRPENDGAKDPDHRRRRDRRWRSRAAASSRRLRPGLGEDVRHGAGRTQAEQAGLRRLRHRPARRIRGRRLPAVAPLAGRHADRLRHGIRRGRPGRAPREGRRRRLPDEALRCGRSRGPDPHQPVATAGGAEQRRGELRHIPGHRGHREQLRRVADTDLRC